MGQWHATVSGPPDVRIPVVLLVPAALSRHRGRRAARLRGHAPKSARLVTGLEGVLVDRDPLELAALEPTDGRRRVLMIAGPAALLVAKVQKTSDRVGSTRSRDKDALDVLRLLRGVTTADLAARFNGVLADPISAQSAVAAARGFVELFRRGGEGTEMAVRAAAGAAEADEIRESIALLAKDLQEAALP